MDKEIKYVELKTGYSDDGPAWIGLVSFSKSGKTIYFNGKAFQSLGGSGIQGNYCDIENDDEYWISNVKKDMSDRHKFGSGDILVEKQILREYLYIVGKSELPKYNYQLSEIETKSPIERINELENQSSDSNEFGDDLYFKQPNELTTEQLEFMVAELIEGEINAKFNKARRSTKKMRLGFETELEKRRELTFANKSNRCTTGTVEAYS